MRSSFFSANLFYNFLTALPLFRQSRDRKFMVQILFIEGASALFTLMPQSSGGTPGPSGDTARSTGGTAASLGGTPRRSGGAAVPSRDIARPSRGTARRSSGTTRPSGGAEKGSIWRNLE